MKDNFLIDSIRGIGYEWGAVRKVSICMISQTGLLMNALKRTSRKKKKEELKNVFRESNGTGVEK